MTRFRTDSPRFTSVARNDDMPNQCYKYSKIQLELYADCEDPDDDGNQEVYQYRTTMERTLTPVRRLDRRTQVGTAARPPVEPARGPESQHDLRPRS